MDYGSVVSATQVEGQATTATVHCDVTDLYMKCGPKAPLLSM